MDAYIINNVHACDAIHMQPIAALCVFHNASVDRAACVWTMMSALILLSSGKEGKAKKFNKNLQEGRAPLIIVS